MVEIEEPKGFGARFFLFVILAVIAFALLGVNFTALVAAGAAYGLLWLVRHLPGEPEKKVVPAHHVGHRAIHAGHKHHASHQ